MATVASKNEFVLCLNNNVYISTLTDLNKEDMLKIDVKPGRYQLIPYYDGYVLTEENYIPKLKDIVKIFWSRSSDKGLSGTYYHGESKDVNQLRLLNKYIQPHLRQDEDYFGWWNESFDEDYTIEYDSDGEEIKREKNLDIKEIPCYHNLPVIFFLNKLAENLDGVDLEMSGKLNKDIIVWKVKDGTDFIGYAVQSKTLIDMLGDQAGLAAFSNARAFGNFEWYQSNVPEFEEHRHFFDNSWIFQPNEPYVCSFKPCSCSVNYYDYDKEKRRKARMEAFAKYQGNKKA